MRPSALFAVPVLVMSISAAAQSQTASAPFQVTQKTEAPGITLSPGSYTVRIADHLNDRMIVQLQKNGSHDVSTLLAYPNAALGTSGSSGPVLFGSGLKSKPTLRGFAFPGGPAVEFVYPKKDAVTLAKANDVKVMAVDPDSEGRPKLPQLTQTDMNEVTLWMLTPTAVQPGTTGPGIQAARYQPASAAPANTEAAATPPPPPAPAPQPSYNSGTSYSSGTSLATNEPAPAQPVQVASNVHPHIRPAVKQLPHTASNLPLIALFGVLSFGLAGGLGATRRVKAPVKA